MILLGLIDRRERPRLGNSKLEAFVCIWGAKRTITPVDGLIQDLLQKENSGLRKLLKHNLKMEEGLCGASGR